MFYMILLPIDSISRIWDPKKVYKKIPCFYLIDCQPKTKEKVPYRERCLSSREAPLKCTNLAIILY